MAPDIPNHLNKIGISYGKLLEGAISVEEFWGILFPFINNLLNNPDYLRYRLILGKVNIGSINNLIFNLRDKRQSYLESMDLGNTPQASVDERLFISVSKKIVDKLFTVLGTVGEKVDVGPSSIYAQNADNTIGSVKQINKESELNEITGRGINISTKIQDTAVAQSENSEIDVKILKTKLTGLQTQLNIHVSQLNLLETQIANYGKINEPPILLNAIDDLRKEISEKEKQVTEVKFQLEKLKPNIN